MYFLILYSGCNKNYPFIYSVHSTFNKALDSLRALTTNLVSYELYSCCKEDLTTEEIEELEYDQFQEKDVSQFYMLTDVVRQLYPNDCDPLNRVGTCPCSHNQACIVRQDDGKAVSAMETFMKTDMFEVSC